MKRTKPQMAKRREIVANQVSAGESVNALARKLGVHRNTISADKKLLEKNARSPDAIAEYQAIKRKIVADLEEFLLRIKGAMDEDTMTAEQLAAYLQTVDRLHKVCGFDTPDLQPPRKEEPIEVNIRFQQPDGEFVPYQEMFPDKPIAIPADVIEGEVMEDESE
jgi:transposase-like protein